MNVDLRPRHDFIAAALIRRQGSLLLVRQQGPKDLAPYWALPGGRVEEGEYLIQGLVREVQEETGLVIEEVGEMAYATRLDNRVDGYRSTTRAFEVAAWRGELAPADPDGLVDAVAFFPLAEAVAHLRQIPYPVMREPAVAYLGADMPVGAVWLYRRQGEGPERLIARLASGGNRISKANR